MKKLLALICLISVGGFAQEISKELAKLDPGTLSNTLDNLGKIHADQLASEHAARLADLSKAGVVVIRQDTLLNVDKPMQVVFNWPVSYGQQFKNKSEEVRGPFVISLYPAKDPNNKDVVQKWRVNYKDGSVKAE